MNVSSLDCSQLSSDQKDLKRFCLTQRRDTRGLWFTSHIEPLPYGRTCKFFLLKWRRNQQEEMTHSPQGLQCEEGRY